MNFWKEKKVEAILLCAVVLGFILRLINVNTKKLLGDPPHFAIQAINFFDSGLLVIWDQSTYLWYAFTNIFYNFFGMTQFATRFPSLLFGTLSILALYLFAKEFSGSKKIAVLSAVLFAFAPGIIIQTADEHDLSVLFFIIMAFYALIYSLKNNSRNYLYISAVIFGVASMWKAYVAVLLIPYIGMIVYYKMKENKKIKEYYKTLIILLGIIILIVSPTLVYNYSNYKHNQVADFLFSTALGISNEKIQGLYGWTAANEIGRSGSKFSRIFLDGYPDDPQRNEPMIAYGIYDSLMSSGKILWPLALLGFLFIYFRRKKDVFAKDYLVFFSLYFFIPFIYMLDGNAMNKHYLHFLTFALPMISYFLINGYDNVAAKYPVVNKLKEGYMPYVVFGLYFLFIVFVSLSLVNSRMGSFYSENPQKDLINYKIDSIERQSLIIYDDRIYNSEAGWLFSDRYYIPASFVTQFMAYNNQSQTKTSVPIYLVECAVDDCGWGTIGNNPTLNKSMEDFFGSLKDQNMDKVFSVKAKVGGVKYYNPLISGEVDMPDQFVIYKTYGAIDLSIAAQIKMQYEYFLMPTEYLNKNSNTFKQFTYTPEGFFEESINDVAWLVFYLNILLSIAIILLLFYELYLFL